VSTMAGAVDYITHHLITNPRFVAPAGAVIQW
jgi:hypothetical protein